MNPVYEKALKDFCGHVNGLAHPNDFDRAVDLFDQLLSHDQYLEGSSY